MSLRRGLSRLSKPTGKAPSTGGESLEHYEAKGGRADSRAGASAVLPGEILYRTHGRLRLIEQRLEPDARYGCMGLNEMLDLEPAVVAAIALDPQFESVDLRGGLFLDTETTGLAGGAGTLPFLTGLSRFEADALVVEQLFVEDYGREQPALDLLRERLESASCVVTFNGKSFDWPLLRTRFVMNRMTVPEPPPHLDLLHCSRRILKRRLESMRLVALERRVLNQHREGDVDGAEIPYIYFDYLETGRADRLAEVILHNELDLLAMPALLGWLGKQYSEIDLEGYPADWVGIAALAARNGDEPRLHRFATAAASQVQSPMASAEAHIMMAGVCHRRGDFESEIRHLRTVLSLPANPFIGKAHLRLAITFEHKLKDSRKALVHAGQTAAQEGFTASEKRCRRLQERLDRNG